MGRTLSDIRPSIDLVSHAIKRIIIFIQSFSLSDIFKDISIQKDLWSISGSDHIGDWAKLSPLCYPKAMSLRGAVCLGAGM